MRFDYEYSEKTHGSKNWDVKFDDPYDKRL